MTACGASTRRDEKKTTLPSREKQVGTSWAEWTVRRRALPPRLATTKTSKLPCRSDANAIHRPSGDQTGLRS
jgi:hypothetical protein